jgi:hypothetical protein
MQGEKASAAKGQGLAALHDRPRTLAAGGEAARAALSALQQPTS